MSTMIDDIGNKIKKYYMYRWIFFIITSMCVLFTIIFFVIFFKTSEFNLKILGMATLGFIVTFTLFILGIRKCSKSYYIEYPYYIEKINISGKRTPSVETAKELVDNYIINNGFYTIETHYNNINNWKYRFNEALTNLSKHRRNEWKKYYEQILDDSNAFHFVMYRNQTRYRQHNYKKTAYKVSMLEKEFACSYRWLKNRNERLAKIDYACSLSKYEHKNQRKLMTRNLRVQIMKRDNYTCQICGKYMPDEVGLQIDHIIPISKGGKSIPSNLQVLCSKCNSNKSNKLA